MKIYTRGGDSGETSLYSGGRVAKDEARIEALGALDELVASLGVAKSAVDEDAAVALIEQVQTELYLAMADIASDGTRAARLPADAAARLETEIDRMDADLPPLTDFVLSGAPAVHMARTICRRAERRVVSAARANEIAPGVLRYINRLSDLLFTLARWAERDTGQADRTFRERL